MVAPRGRTVPFRNSRNRAAAAAGVRRSEPVTAIGDAIDLSAVSRASSTETKRPSRSASRRICSCTGNSLIVMADHLLQQDLAKNQHWRVRRNFPATLADLL